MFSHDKSASADGGPRRPRPEGQAPAKAPSNPRRLVWVRLAVPACMASLCIVAVALAAAQDKRAADVPKIDAKALTTLVQSFDKVELQKHPWGWIRWLMNSKLDPKAEMTFGIVQINAHQRNPMHVHPNCEEQLYVLSGSCKHVLGKETVVLKTGDVIRIPAGVPHKAWPIGDQPLKAVIVYSSGDRQFVVVEE